MLYYVGMVKKIFIKSHALFEMIGDFTIFSLKTILYIFKPPYRIHLILTQLICIGIESIMIITLSSFAIGMIFSLQMLVELAKFNAQAFTPNVIAQALSRELAPIITTLVLIAKNGSAFASEIGSMNSNEQINVMKTMSVNPIQYLASPRLIACVIMFPALTGLANIVGIIGGFLISFGLKKLEYAFAVNLMFSGLEPMDILSGLIKAMIMGFTMCLVCCYSGFNAPKGSSGIGRATTSAVVVSSVLVLLINLVLGQFFLLTNIST